LTFTLSRSGSPPRATEKERDEGKSWRGKRKQKELHFFCLFPFMFAGVLPYVQLFDSMGHRFGKRLNNSSTSRLDPARN
jgi:hypothetical protein